MATVGASTFEPLPPGTLHAHMQNELGDLLKILGGGEESDSSYYKPPSPDVSFSQPKSADITEDPLESNIVGNRGTRVAQINPPPAARQNVNPIGTENVQNVPIVQARLAEPTSVEVTVSPQKGISDTSFSSFIAISRAANSNARASGVYLASVVQALGEDGASTTTADPLSLFVRIAQALLAAEQGATASAQPSVPLRVIQTPLATLGQALNNAADFLPVYLPTRLSSAAKSALISILNNGGPADYTWRYRGAGGAREQVMPAVTRFKTPGGYNEILAVTEGVVNLPAVGGAALRVQPLRELERFYRGAYGNDMMDTAWRTAMSLGSVYVVPRAVANPPALDPGRNFVVYDVTKQLPGEEGLDLGDADDWVDQPPPPEDNNMSPFTFPGPADDGRERWLARTLWTLVVASVRAGSYPNEEFSDEDVNLRNFSDFTNEAGGFRFLFSWEGPGEGRRREQHPGENFLFDRDLTLAQTGILENRDADRLRAILAEENGWELGTPRGRPDPAQPIVDGTPIRNVFGAVDVAMARLPVLDLVTAVGVVATYLRPLHRPAKMHSMTPQNRRVRLKQYAAHLHIANFLQYVAADLFPADLHAQRLPHARYYIKLPPALRSAYVMDDLGPECYPTQNWFVLESPYVVRDVDDATPFAGFGVAGSWRADASARVKLSDSSTSFAAVEAALRNDVSDGARVSANADFQGTHFGIVRGRSGLLNALPVAPRIRSQRAYDEVTLASEGGLSVLVTGTNAHYRTVRVA